MEQYIDKNRVEEILRNLWKKDDGYNAEHRICYNKALQEVQCELDTLEVKEVDTIEREVKEDAGGYPFIEATELYDYDNDKPLAKAGDRVKVVFIKDK